MSKPTPEQLQAWTDEANEFMESTGRKRFPAARAAELRELGAKRCTRCTVVRELSDYSSDTTRRDGLFPWCKPCKSADDRQYRKEHAEEKAARDRAYYAKNREEIRERNGEYRERNRDTIRERQSEYREQNREELRERQREARRRDPLAHRIHAGRVRAKEYGVPNEGFSADDLRAYWSSIGLDEDRSAFSGVLLTPGTVSLDHVIPLSAPNSPGHVVSNIVPCLIGENRSKNDKHWIRLVNNEPDPDAPELVKRALEPGAPSRSRRTLMLQL